ncbi:MAG TPA: tripartite tricarboxylate transporter substrate binding protein [Burkholderiaceae bacterium]|nr:tripartite tricarboxylate transporter substrate binding protein [Burkholderiaceae bacterium]
MQRRHLMLGALAAALPLSGRAQADDYPKPGATLRYIVPFPPGGLTDVMARLVGQQLAEHWKAHVVIDNRPGSGGQIGADAAAKSPPDGHTLLAITLTHAANVTLFPKAPYHFTRDLKPVALLAGSPMLIVVPATGKIGSFKELVAAARAGKLNAGSSGNGTPPHLTLALFNDIARTEIQHVPYKGGAPSITDLIGGQLDVIFSNFPESIAHVKSGKLRALAICSAARHPAVPDVPTTAEAGMPGLVTENWTGVMVPAGTPDAIVDKLGAEVLKIMADPELAERAKTQGFRVDARGPQAFALFLKSEIERWGGVIAAAHITPE